MLRPLKVAREKLWAEIVARRLLTGLVSGGTGPIGGGEIEAACDEAIKRIIGPVDRERFTDETFRQVVHLSSEYAPPR